jgi:hypothetical protein
MLYIDGVNLKSVGNILCIVGIILAIFALFYSWYAVSYDLSGPGIPEGLRTAGMTDLLRFDGINGIQIVIPGQSGPTPVGTFVLPFSFLIGISLLFLIIASIGIHHSKKLGGKYIWRGVRLLIPIIIIIIVIAAIGSLIHSSSVAGAGEEVEKTLEDVLKSVSGSPFGGEKTFNIPNIEDGIVPLKIQWGLGIGAILLLLSAIILIVAGVLEILANTQFFATKIPVGKQVKQPPTTSGPPVQQPESEPPQKNQKTSSETVSFCPECGEKLEKDALFCPECGKKLK